LARADQRIMAVNRLHQLVAELLPGGPIGG